jgi:hypothetical protein
MRNDATILKDYVLIALRLIGQSIHLVDTNAIEQFVSHTNTLLQQQHHQQNNHIGVSLVSIEDVLLEYIKNVIVEPHMAYCATHIYIGTIM